MRKRSARRAYAPAYLLLPEQVAKYITPVRIAVELLPMGLFTLAHANSVLVVVNLVTADSAGRGNGMWEVAHEAGDVIVAMYERVKQGKPWNTTAEERRTLIRSINACDRYMRSWTSARLNAAILVNIETERVAKANGGQFMDKVDIEVKA